MLKSLPPWVSYVVPFVVYLALTGIEVRFPAHYPQLYTGKIVLVAILVFCLHGSKVERRPAPWGWFAVAAVLGVILNWVWFPIDRVTPHPSWLTHIMGTRPGFNPFKAIVDPVWRTIFIAVRFSGLVLLIPYIEERFYRDFILRYATDPNDFTRVPIGKLDPVAVGFSTVLFASSHPEWLSALVFALVMCALAKFSKDIRVCMVAHAVTNLALGITVITTGQWCYW